MIGSARFNIEFFHYDQWLGVHIKKDYILVNSRELAVALCLLKMTQEGSDEAEIDYIFNEVRELTQEIRAEDEDEYDDICPPELLPPQKAVDTLFAAGGLTQGAKYMRSEMKAEIEYMSVDADGAAVPQVRPFVRFFARSIDENLFSTMVILLCYYSRDTFGFILRLKYIPLTALIWILIEAVLLSTWGTTLGKWLLRVKVRNLEGNKLRFRQALLRSFLVILCGECFQIAYMNYAASIFSFFYLRKKGKTLWDEAGGFTVSHERIGSSRVTITVFIALATVAAIFFSVFLGLFWDMWPNSYNFISWAGLRF